MSTTEMKQRLIGRIREIENEEILAEAYRLLGMKEEQEMPFQLNAEQKKVVEEARHQIKSGSSSLHLELLE